MRIDGEFVDFEPIPIKSDYDIDANYKILIDLIPDGQEHQIACCFIPDGGVIGFGDSGERYMAVDFYDMKMYSQIRRIHLSKRRK